MVRIACVAVAAAVLFTAAAWLSIPIVLDLMVRVYCG